MARKSISIAEAFQVLEAAGVKLERKKAEAAYGDGRHETLPILKPKLPKVRQRRERQPTRDWSDYPSPGPYAAKERIGRPRVITLYAKHSIASGDPQQLLTFGPGKCTVPASLADALLHQDMLAREADARLLETTPRHYLIVKKANASGHAVAVGLQVTPDILDNIGLLDQRFLL